MKIAEAGAGFGIGFLVGLIIVLLVESGGSILEKVLCILQKAH